MIKNNLKELKKYIFLISLFVFLVSASHLVYQYVFHNSKSLPIKGGVVSEGIIGDFPHLNPLIPSSKNDKYVNSILYRSLLKYDFKNGKVISDLANCDISDLKRVECYLENNIFWSNKEKIKLKDIVSTYNILKTTDTNPEMKYLLKDVSIEKTEKSIVFKNLKRNTSFINIFFQPILSDEKINNLGIKQLAEPFLPDENSLYSGKFKVGSIGEDKNLGIKVLNLEKNENYHNNDVYIDKFNIKVFDNSNDLLKNKDTVNIFNDEKNIIGESIPRLESHYYSSPKYLSLFLNFDNIKSKKLRNYILNKIDRRKLINILGDKNFKGIKNPYLIDYELDKKVENSNLEGMMEYIGYFKKSKLLKVLSDKLSKNEEKETSNEKEISNKESEKKDEIKKENPKLNFIISGLKNKFNFVSEDDILLKGKVDKDIESVYVNDYKLKGYNKGDDYFYYRLREGGGYDSIKQGKNTYKIYYEKSGKKEFKEEVIVFYDKDEEKLEKQKKDFFKVEKKEVEPKPRKDNGEDNDKKSILSKNISNLDDNYFYNKDLKKFSLDLVYITGENDVEITVNFIKETLEKNGIGINTKALNLKDVSNFVSESNSGSYDIFLAGINLGIFNHNLYSYFHSSQAKSGYNFSNIKKLSLDIILEDLNSNKISKDSIQKEQKKVLEILKGEYVIKTLYTPLYDLLIDRNIRNVNIPKKVDGDISRVDYLPKIYINERKDINYKNKSFSGFIDYLYAIISGKNDK